jgi:hypothetical protein
VNHALDATTLKIANNTWVTWSSLILLIIICAQLNDSAFFMGIDEDGYYNFLFMGLVLIVVHVVLYAVVLYASQSLMVKLGATGTLYINASALSLEACVCSYRALKCYGVVIVVFLFIFLFFGGNVTGNVEQEFEAVKAIWPEVESWHNIHGELRDIEQKVIDDAKKRKKGAHKIALKKSLKSAAQSVRTAARLSSVGRRVKNMGKRYVTCHLSASPTRLSLLPLLFTSQKITVKSLAIANTCQRQAH